MPSCQLDIACAEHCCHVSSFHLPLQARGLFLPHALVSLLRVAPVRFGYGSCTEPFHGISRKESPEQCRRFLPLPSVFFSFLPFSSVSIFFHFFRVPIFSFFSVFFLSSVFSRFIFRKKRGDTVRETPFAKPRFQRFCLSVQTVPPGKESSDFLCSLRGTLRFRQSQFCFLLLAGKTLRTVTVSVPVQFLCHPAWQTLSTSLPLRSEKN